jgi:hypothetical protein
MYIHSEQILFGSTLQRANTENSKQIFPETELLGHSPNFHILWSTVPISTFFDRFTYSQDRFTLFPEAE